MKEIQSNVEGKLLSVKLESNGMGTVKIKDAENKIHIYKGLSSFHVRGDVKVGDLIGEVEGTLHYEVQTKEDIAISLINAYKEHITDNVGCITS